MTIFLSEPMPQLAACVNQELGIMPFKTGVVEKIFVKATPAVDRQGNKHRFSIKLIGDDEWYRVWSGKYDDSLSVKSVGRVLNKGDEIEFMYDRARGCLDVDKNTIQPISGGVAYEKIITWAKVRGIFESSDPKTQALKTVSEVGELADNIAKGRHDAAKDDIGDIVVTLIILCEMIGTNLHECLEVAYKEISKRKGKMVNGVFVKQGDE
jgi:NTP pyrophosphatase (non-canonical NTP hydrolase)